MSIDEDYQRQSYTTDGQKVTVSTKLAGEDFTNDVMKVREAATYTNLSASALIKTGAGCLKGIIINSHSSGTLKLWDNISLKLTTPTGRTAA